MMTMADIENLQATVEREIEQENGFHFSMRYEVALELLARAKAWEWIRTVDSTAMTTREVGIATGEIVDKFNAAAEKGFRP